MNDITAFCLSCTLLKVCVFCLFVWGWGVLGGLLGSFCGFFVVVDVCLFYFIFCFVSLFFGVFVFVFCLFDFYDFYLSVAIFFLEGMSKAKSSNLYYVCTDGQRLVVFLMYLSSFCLSENLRYHHLNRLRFSYNRRKAYVYFSFQLVLHDWCNKSRGMCNHVCGIVHIK